MSTATDRITAQTPAVEWLEGVGACREAIEWAEGRTLGECWRDCRRPDHMIWSLEQIGYSNETVLRKFACRCVRQVWHLLDDERSKRTVEVAERFADGIATREELAAAWDAAWSAATAWVAWSAVKDAMTAARATSAAVRGAAWAVTDVTRAVTEATQADILRELIPDPFSERSQP